VSTAVDAVSTAFTAAVNLCATALCRANQMLETTAPWTALKKGSEEEKREAAATLLTALEAARIVAAMLAPVVPGISRRVYAQLGMEDAFEVRCSVRIACLTVCCASAPQRWNCASVAWWTSLGRTS
jgi:methionyl-tRNA synthetase